MATIIPLHRYRNASPPIRDLCRECRRIGHRMTTARDDVSYRTHQAELERTMLALSRRTPETSEDAAAYCRTALLHLECMIAAWDDQPTPAEARLLRMLEQLHRYLSRPFRSPV